MSLPALAQLKAILSAPQQITETKLMRFGGGRTGRDAKKVCGSCLENKQTTEANSPGDERSRRKATDDAIAGLRYILAARDRSRAGSSRTRSRVFLATDYENDRAAISASRARRSFAEVKANIDQSSGAILRLKRCVLRGVLAVAQDPTRNGAKSVHLVDLYGFLLPLRCFIRRRTPEKWGRDCHESAANGRTFATI